MPSDFRPVVGHRYTIPSRAHRVDRLRRAVLAEVLDLEPERMLRRWRGAGPAAGVEVDRTVTWTLRPEGRGTRLFLAPPGSTRTSPAEQRARDIMGGGWRSGVLKSLQAVLAGM